MKTKYYKKDNLIQVNIELMKLYNLKATNDIVVARENNLIIGFLEFVCSDKIIIKNIYIVNNDKNILSYLISKLIYINYLKKDIEISKEVFINLQEQISTYFICEELDGKYLLKLKDLRIRRFIEIGKYKTGKLNNICDVKGVMVGHSSINRDEIHTGVTAILPHGGNIFKEKVLAATYVYNGFGKSTGLMQIDELGTIETPILITNTLNVGKVSDGLVEYLLQNNPEIGITTGTVNPIVLECNDGTLNDIRARVLNTKNVFDSIYNCVEDFEQGNIGAGSGMTCHGFKGGIGSSSRVINIKGKEYTVGVLVNSNFLGSTPKNLIISNHYFGDVFTNALKEDQDKGSITIVVATDIPLSERQLKRVCKRAVLGIGKTGGYAGNGSGDIVVGFTTANKVNHFSNEPFISINSLSDDYIDEVFKATIDATEEAIINSLLYSKTVVGYKGHTSESINEHIEFIDHILIENILEEKKECTI